MAVKSTGTDAIRFGRGIPGAKSFCDLPVDTIETLTGSECGLTGNPMARYRKLHPRDAVWLEENVSYENYQFRKEVAQVG